MTTENTNNRRSNARNQNAKKVTTKKAPAPKAKTLTKAAVEKQLAEVTAKLEKAVAAELSARKIKDSTLGQKRAAETRLKAVTTDLELLNALYNPIKEIIMETVKYLEDNYSGADGKIHIASWKFWTWISVGKYLTGQVRKFIDVINAG